MPQRSLINLWLLLAATICVDAVAMSWTYSVPLRRPEALYVALVAGQLSVLCVWASFSPRPQLWRLLIPFVFALAAALWAGMAYLNPGPDISRQQLTLAYVGLWLAHASLLLALVWAVRRSGYGQRWGNAADASGWQFSIKQLLVIMTTLAVLIVVLRKAELIHEVWLWAIIVIANSVGVAVAGVLLHGAPWHGFLRFAATAAVAALLGIVLYAIRRWPDIIAVNLIHAFILFVWIEVGGIIPSRNGARPPDRAGSNQ